MNNQKELLISWLQRAHAMEESLASILEQHAQYASGHPKVRLRIEDHLKKTREHSELVRENLERLNGGISMITKAKEMTAEITAAFAVILGPISEDQLIKNTISDYAAGHLEMASYNAILTLARAMKDRKAISMCRTILKDEKEMAKWLEKNLPTTVTNFIQAPSESEKE